MTSHPKHELKIADTSDDDVADDSSNTISLTPTPPPNSTKSDLLPPNGVDREMELEIDRVKRLNGIPRLALDTCRDEQ